MMFKFKYIVAIILIVVSSEQVFAQKTYPDTLVLHQNLKFEWEVTYGTDSTVQNIKVYEKQSTTYRFWNNNFIDSTTHRLNLFVFEISIFTDSIAVKNFDEKGKTMNLINLSNNVIKKIDTTSCSNNMSTCFVVAINNDSLSHVQSISFNERQPVLVNTEKLVPKKYNHENFCLLIQFANSYKNEDGKNEVLEDGNLLISISSLYGDRLNKSIIILNKKLVGGF